MRKPFRRGLAMAVAGLILSACSVVGIRTGTEETRYEVVERIGDGVEIRRYPARLAAETTVPGSDGGVARGQAFRRLAGFIFGDNRPGEKIAMTAPVTTDTDGAAMTMRFFMPAAYSRASLPEPSDPSVRIVELPPATLAVLRFTGSTSPAAVAPRATELDRILAGSTWRATGPPFAMFYDPPWTIPFLRRNEVAVPVATRG